ncbi:hypothetical protein [Vibrio phage Artemius]|nr:hypothetical protein [Vibrio phage Artemius]
METKYFIHKSGEGFIKSKGFPFNIDVTDFKEVSVFEFLYSMMVWKLKPFLFWCSMTIVSALVCMTVTGDVMTTIIVTISYFIGVLVGKLTS